MDKRKISEDVYERYVDASVALFMEYYAASCLDGSESPHTDGKDFPAELDTRCRALINRECGRQRRRAFLKSAGKCLGAVACLAIFLLSLSSVLFMTVEAVRVPVINYYIERGNRYWEISSNDHSTNKPVKSFDLSNPLGKILPKEFQLINIQGDSLERLSAKYKNLDGIQVILYTCPLDGTSRIDTEDSDNAKEINLLGYDAFFILEDNFNSLTWIDEHQQIIFGLNGYGITEEYIISIAEELILLIND